eukprot:15463601-Alexandrium_andersonii.AAC.1
MLGRAGLATQPFEDARWTAVRLNQATEGDLRQLAGQSPTELKPVNRRALTGAFGDTALAAMVAECRGATVHVP